MIGNKFLMVTALVVSLISVSAQELRGFGSDVTDEAERRMQGKKGGGAAKRAPAKGYAPAKGAPAKGYAPAKGAPAKGYAPAKGAPAKGAPAKGYAPAKGVYGKKGGGKKGGGKKGPKVYYKEEEVYYKEEEKQAILSFHFVQNPPQTTSSNPIELGSVFITNEGIYNQSQAAMGIPEVVGYVTGICTRTQVYEFISSESSVLSGGSCQFTYTDLFKNSLTVSGEIFDEEGGTLAITGGTHEYQGSFGEVKLTPFYPETSATTDVFTDVEYYEGHMSLYLKALHSDRMPMNPLDDYQPASIMQESESEYSESADYESASESGS